MKADVEKRLANRRRGARYRARDKAGLKCGTVEYDSAVLDKAVRAGYLGNFETNKAMINAALTKLLRGKKSANALACPHCGRRIIDG